MRGLSRFTILAAFVILCWPLLPSGTPTLVAQITWEDRTPGVLNHESRFLGPDTWMYRVRDSLWRSSDAGLNWARISLPVLPEKRDLWFWDWRSDGHAVLTFVKVVDNRDSCFVTFAFTNDNGASWEVKSSRILDKVPLSNYLFPKKALLAGTSALLFCLNEEVYRSTDRGETFERCNVPKGVDDLTVDEAGNGWAYLIGKQAARTTDGGASWDMLDLPDYFQRIEFHPNGIVAGFGSTVYLSTSMGEQWMRVPLPEGEDTGVMGISAIAPLDTSNIWMFATASNRHFVLMTIDGGLHWSWETASHQTTSAIRLDHARAVVNAGTVMLLTIPEQRPFQLQVYDRSSLLRTEVLLEWNDPGCAGQVEGYTLEWSGADSLWTRIDPSPDTELQYMYVVLPESASGSCRYRLTMHATSGETYSAISDSLTAQRGKYVDLVEALLPGPEDGVSEITYEHRVFNIHRDLGGRYDTLDTTVTVVYGRLPAEHPYRWVTRYPLRKIIRYPSGEADTSVAYLTLYSDWTRRWRFEDGASGTFHFGFPELGWPRLIRDATDNFHSADPQLVPAEHAGIATDSDTLVLYTKMSMPFGGEDWFEFVCKPATGFIHYARHWGGDPRNCIRFVSAVNATTDLDARMPDFTLAAAWPNPFLEETMLAYRLGNSGSVRLSVHDVLGREIALLVDGWSVAGSHTVAFRAHDLPSGMYLVRLQAGGRIEMKMIVRAR